MVSRITADHEAALLIDKAQQLGRYLRSDIHQYAAVRFKLQRRPASSYACMRKPMLSFFQTIEQLGIKLLLDRRTRELLFLKSPYLILSDTCNPRRWSCKGGHREQQGKASPKRAENCAPSEASRCVFGPALKRCTGVSPGNLIQLGPPFQKRPPICLQNRSAHSIPSWWLLIQNKESHVRTSTRRETNVRPIAGDTDYSMATMSGLRVRKQAGKCLDNEER